MQEKKRFTRDSATQLKGLSNIFEFNVPSHLPVIDIDAQFDDDLLFSSSDHNFSNRRSPGYEYFNNNPQIRRFSALPPVSSQSRATNIYQNTNFPPPPRQVKPFINHALTQQFQTKQYARYPPPKSQQSQRKLFSVHPPTSGNFQKFHKSPNHRSIFDNIPLPLGHRKPIQKQNVPGHSPSSNVRTSFQSGDHRFRPSNTNRNQQSHKRPQVFVENRPLSLGFQQKHKPNQFSSPLYDTDPKYSSKPKDDWIPTSPGYNQQFSYDPILSQRNPVKQSDILNFKTYEDEVDYPLLNIEENIDDQYVFELGHLPPVYSAEKEDILPPNEEKFIRHNQFNVPPLSSEFVLPGKDSLRDELNQIYDEIPVTEPPYQEEIQYIRTTSPEPSYYDKVNDVKGLSFPNETHDKNKFKDEIALTTIAPTFLTSVLPKKMPSRTPIKIRDSSDGSARPPHIPGTALQPELSKLTTKTDDRLPNDQQDEG